MNVRPPWPATAEFLAVQDSYLAGRLRERGGAISADGIPVTNEGLAVWQGDITRLAADAIVNAANSQMLGCFVPNHRCIDNAIHTYAGLEVGDKAAHDRLDAGRVAAPDLVVKPLRCGCDEGPAEIGKVAVHLIPCVLVEVLLAEREESLLLLVDHLTDACDKLLETGREAFCGLCIPAPRDVGELVHDFVVDAPHDIGRAGEACLVEWRHQELLLLALGHGRRPLGSLLLRDCYGLRRRRCLLFGLSSAAGAS